MRWAPERIPFSLQVGSAIAMTVLFVLWIQNDWGGSWVTTAFANIASTLVPLGAAWACQRRARLVDGTLREAWFLLGAACLCWAGGQAVWTAIELDTGAPPGSPSLADVGYLLLIPLAALGMARMARTPGHAAIGLSRVTLDGAIIGSSLMFIAFVFGLEQFLLAAPQGDAGITVNLVYPFGDVMVATIGLLSLGRAPRAARRMMTMLVTGTVLLGVADAWFLFVDAEGQYSTGGILDAFWVMGFQFIGLAAMRPANLAVPLDAPRQTWTLASLPMTPFLVAAVAATYAQLRDGFLSDTLFWTALVVILLVVVRMLVMLLDNVGLSARAERVARELREERAVRIRMMNAITHDMLNAMSPIRLQLHMMQNRMLGDFTQKQAEGIAMVQRNAEQMARLASDIKEGSNVEEGRLVLQPADMDLVATVREAVANRQAEADRRGVAVFVEAPPALVCRGDAGRLTQVADNLISNALKFTRQGGRIRVHVEGGPDGSTVVVSDTGRGLIPDEAARLFQPYSQVHDPNEIQERGTGLGLFISRGIVEGHGGRIWVESGGYGRGSTFAFWIPKAPAQTAAPTAALAEAPTGAAAGVST